MSRRKAEVVPIVKRGARRTARPARAAQPSWRRDSVELVGVALRPADHFTRLWPTGEHTDGAFLLAMLPVRLAAIALLWATSTPARLLVTVAASTAVLLTHTV
jgi:hypothetical protein